MATISAKLQLVRDRINAAVSHFSRSEGSVALLAVSKTFPSAAIREALAQGQHRFGENYVQEALDKMADLSDLRDQIEWHMIGPLQSNKTRPVAEHFDWVHTVDRLKIAQRLNDQRPVGLPPLQVCIQVNTSAEESKSGVAPAEALTLAREVSALPRLRLRGIMALPAPTSEPTEQGRQLAAVRAIYDSLREQGLPLDTLSMGMSADLEAAIEQGSTMVRVGTALFGQR